MRWSTIDFKKLVFQLLPSFLRKSRILIIFSAFVKNLQIIADETLYKMQHDGRKIYLEKMLNEYFQVQDYDHQNHESSKLIYIEDLPVSEKLYIFQDYESDNTFLEDDDDDNENDVFLDGDTEGIVSYSWVIFIPDTISFNEYSLRALVDSYRYAGKKYKIETYTI